MKTRYAALGLLLALLALGVAGYRYLPERPAEAPEAMAGVPTSAQFAATVQPHDEKSPVAVEDQQELPDGPENPGPQPKSRADLYMEIDPHAAGRSLAQIEEIRGESLLETLDKIGRTDMYRWPPPRKGVGGSGGVLAKLPLRSRAGGPWQHNMMGNRRVLRALWELRELPATEAARIVNERMTAAQEVHLNFREQWPIGTPIPEELRYPGPGEYDQYYRESLALAFVAGQIGLEGSHDAVLGLAQAAIHERDTILSDQGIGERIAATSPQLAEHGDYAARFVEGARALSLADASLYNRQVLAVALAGTLPGGRGIEAELADFGIDVLRQRLTPYDVLLSAYDDGAVLGAGPDFSQGVFEAVYVPETSDEQFEALLAAYLDR